MRSMILVVTCGGVIVAVLAALAAALLGRIKAAVQLALSERLDSMHRGQERIERVVREEIASDREERGTSGKQLRDELRGASKDAADSTIRTLGLFGERLDALTARVEERLGALQRATEERLDQLRGTVDERLKTLQADNERRLDQMRKTVDEKLEGTLEKRLGESFKLVSDRLEAVQRGLGEMHTLANGVGDLKKVLVNVKVRGTWGEIQLGSLLEQMLAPDQFVTNAATRAGSSERVEFAVKLPGPGEDKSSEILLPIDAKFPVEDYRRLIEASERGDADSVDQCGRQLELRIKTCAKDIRDKYLNPPCTTDFGILFLPTEGLYAEIARRTGLLELVQRDFKVMVAGPSNLAALLNSLQMGFRTLAIQKRSSEVWEVLGAVKSEFVKFGGVLQKVDKKLQEASNTLQDVGVRSRAIERKLRVVQELPAIEATRLLAEGDVANAEIEQGVP